jgi:phage tail sheath gpL-like
MTATQIATSIAAAINAAVDGYTGNPLALTAAAGGATVTITARHKGASGNDIDFRVAYLGAAAGETVPAGVTLTLTPMSGGATNPSTLMNLLLPNLMDQLYDFICVPYSDTNSLNAVQSFMNDITGRWSWERQDYGHVFSAARGTISALQTLGTARNDQHVSVMGYNDSPSPSWQWAAAFMGACSVSLQDDPGLPIHYQPLIGVYAPPQQSRFQMVDRNTLSFSGISTFTVQRGICQIEMDITTYQTNAAGVADDSYLKIETMFLLAACLRYMRAGVTSVMARKKLADDGTRVSPGSNVVTPVIIKAYLIGKYQEMLNLGWVQDLPDFAANIIVQRNALNPNRVDVLWPGVLINQLDVFALLAQFRLSSSSFNTQLAA